MYAFYPLYMLYQAIKTQAEKGPIDEGTGEAYYTLEFKKLFDQTVEFHSLVSTRNVRLCLEMLYLHSNKKSYDYVKSYYHYAERFRQSKLKCV